MSLLSELKTDPAAMGYATPMAVNDDDAVAALLNDRRFSLPASRSITARGILSDYPGGPAAAAAVLDKLDAAAPSISALKWAWAFIKGEGIDIGNAATQGMLDQLGAGGVLTTTEADNLKSLANKPTSRAEIVVGRLVSSNDVAVAVRDRFGTPL